jgi:hypothetical protein
LVASVTDRNLRSHTEARPESKAECTDQANVAGIPERIPTWKRSNRQVQADNRANARRDEDIQPRSEPALDAAQLGRRDACCPRDGCQRQRRSGASRTQLAPKLGQGESAATGAPGRVGLGHRHILTERAHQPINRTATIAP